MLRADWGGDGGGGTDEEEVGLCFSWSAVGMSEWVSGRNEVRSSRVETESELARPNTLRLRLQVCK